MSDVVKKQYKRTDKMTQEEKEEHRKEQLRNAQRKYRESHGLIKPVVSVSEEEKLKRKKEKAHERYLKKKQNASEPKKKEPESYTIEYQREYHKNYYQKNRDKLLTRCKEYYHIKKVKID